ncbi:MAG: GNAT family N-acetyltransferase [Thermoleophilaceae bacterium]
MARPRRRALAAAPALPLAAGREAVTLSDGEIALRPFIEDDVPAITAACQDPEIPRWTLVPSPYTEEDARAFRLGRGRGLIRDRRRRDGILTLRTSPPIASPSGRASRARRSSAPTWS